LQKSKQQHYTSNNACKNQSSSTIQAITPAKTKSSSTIQAIMPAKNQNCSVKTNNNDHTKTKLLETIT
jgi:hypothetical protein